MSTNNLSSKKVTLQTFEDWGRWDEEFQTKAMSLHLWEFINPESDETLMQRPERPNVGAYSRRVPPRPADPDLAPSGVQTRRGGQSSQTILSQSSAGEPVVSLPETVDPHHHARNVSELTAEDKATFTFEWRVYEQDHREYKEQEANCEKLKAWVTETVDYGLRQSSCRAIWDLRTWYTNLKTSVGATQREQQIAARRNYQAAITPLAKIPKDFANWITAWEMATNHALVMKTGGVDDPNTWFDDLAKAIQPVLGNWVTIYTGIYKDKLEGKTLTIGEVAKDLRKEVERQTLIQPQKGHRVTKGVFGPTFAGESSTLSQTRLGRPRERYDPAITEKQAVVSGRPGKALQLRESGCQACEGNHALSSCYYVFPEKAPEYFKGRKLVCDAVEHRLKTDQNLKTEVDRIKKSTQPKEAE
ncbi:gag protein [Fusarium oxysporum f. sp. phaseoli]